MSTTIKIGIVGSRNYKNLEKVEQWIRILADRAKIKNIKLVIVSGGARGVDKTAENEAKRLGLETQIFLPKYLHANDIVAPLRRNTEIVENSDYLYAFRSPGISNGTDDSIEKARKTGKLVKVFGE